MMHGFAECEVIEPSHGSGNKIIKKPKPKGKGKGTAAQA